MELFVLVIPILWLLFSITAAVVASGKGRSGVGWFIISLPLLGIFGMIMVMGLPSLKQQDFMTVNPDGTATMIQSVPKKQRDDYAGLFVAIAIAGGVAWVLAQMMGG